MCSGLLRNRGAVTSRACHSRIASARRRRLQVRPASSAPRPGGPSPPLSRSSPQLGPHKSRPDALTPQARRFPARRAPTAPRPKGRREKPLRTVAPAAPRRAARPVRAGTRGSRSPPALGAPKRALRRRRRAPRTHRRRRRLPRPPAAQQK